MGYDGPEFYDNATVFATYLKSRGRVDNANDTLEKPIIVELLGSVAGKTVLDLGCGDAALGKELLEQGAASYLGLDGSHRMVELARERLAGSTGQVERADMRAWAYPVERFDCVVARLALHYIEDLSRLFLQVFRTLRPGGLFVFSVEHPVITSSDRARQTDGIRQAWIVDGYFDSGPRVTLWMGEQVVKYHRTVEEYFTNLQAARFVVERLRESRPERGQFADELTYLRRRRIPLFLCLASRRPSVVT